MEYEKDVQDKIAFLSKIFEEFSVDSILEDQNFSTDEYSDRHYVKLTSNSAKGNKIPARIHLAKDGIQLDIDGISEAFGWSNEDISHSPDKISSFIKLLFSSYILTEYCKSHTTITLFDNEGNYKGKYDLTTSVVGFIDGILKRECHQKLFFPTFPV